MPIVASVFQGGIFSTRNAKGYQTVNARVGILLNETIQFRRGIVIPDYSYLFSGSSRSNTLNMMLGVDDPHRKMVSVVDYLNNEE